MPTIDRSGAPPRVPHRDELARAVERVARTVGRLRRGSADRDVLADLLVVAEEVVGVRASIVFRAAGPYLEPLAHRGVPPKIAAALSRVHREGDGLLPRALGSGKIVLARSARGSSDVGPLLSMDGARLVAALPLDELAPTALVLCCVLRPTGVHEQISLLRLLGGIACTVTDGLAVAAAEQRARARLEAVSRAALALAGATELDARTRVAVSEARRLVGADGVLVELVEVGTPESAVLAEAVHVAAPSADHVSPASDGRLLRLPLAPEGRELLRFVLWRGPASPPFDAEDRVVAGLFGEHAAAALAQAASRAVLVRERADLRREQAAVAAREAHLSRVFYTAPVGLGVIAADGRFDDVNFALSEILGRTPEELRKLTLDAITHPHDAEAERWQASELFEGAVERYHHARRMFRPDGSIVDTEVSITRLPEARGPGRFIVQIDDVSERRRAELALLDGQSELDAVFENALDAMLLLDSDARIVRSNPAAGELFGRSRADLAGTSLFALFRGPVPPNTWTSLLAEGRGVGEVTLALPSGRLVECEYRARAHVRPGRHVAFLRDVTDERRAVAALRRIRDSLERAQRLTRLGSWEWDLVAGRMTWSEECARVLGLDLGHVPSREALLARVAPLDRDAVAAAIEASVSHAAPFALQHGVLGPRDEERIVLHRAEVVRDDRGRVLSVAGSLHDVTEQARSQDALRRSEARLRVLAENVRDMILQVRLEPERRFEYVSPSVEDVTGRRPEDFYEDQQLALRIMLPEDRKSFRRLEEAALAGGGETTFRVVHRDGGVRWIELRVSPVRRSVDGSAMIVAVGRDITRQKEAELARESLAQRVEEKRRWLTTVIESSPVGVVLVTQGGHHITANRRAEQILGMQLVPERGVEQYLPLLYSVSGAPLPADQTMAGRALRGETVAAGEVLVRRRDGAEVPVLVSAAPIPPGAGDEPAAVVIVEDISYLKEFDRLREEWTSMVAHDLRQPVTAITAFASLLRRRGADQERGWSEHILGSARRLNRMIGDLLEASRLESRRLTLELQEVRLGAALAGIVERLQVETPSNPLVLDAGDEEVVALVDEARLEQIVGNLVSNAVKYGDRGAEIRVRLRRKGDAAELSIGNRGRPIPEDDLPYVFERFRRGDESRTRAQGLGLGLYIVRGLVEAHGGSIVVESDERETIFRIVLPLRDGAEA